MANQKEPLVSVIVITYNSEKFILETLESIKNQTYNKIELIISDDYSTDKTIEICKNWIAENKQRFIRSQIVTTPENTGIPANCNRGIIATKGEWIRIIAGDDALLSDSTKRYIDFINKEENFAVEVLHSNAERYDGSFSQEKKLPFRSLANLKFNNPSITAEEQFESLLRSNKVLAGSLFIKKLVFDKIGLYDEEPKLWEDRPMLLKMTSKGIKLHYLDFCSLKYRRHLSSIQSQKKIGKLLPDYVIIRYSYYYKKYRHYLPFCERIVSVVLLKRVIWLDKLGLNKNKFLIKILFKITGFPWIYFSNHYKNKYL